MEKKEKHIDFVESKDIFKAVSQDFLKLKSRVDKLEEIFEKYQKESEQWQRWMEGNLEALSTAVGELVSVNKAVLSQVAEANKKEKVEEDVN